MRFFSFQNRDDGIVIGITFWQWIVEIIISVILAFLHMIRGENRALEHFIVLFLAMISYAFFPAFMLLADNRFRRKLEEKGFKTALMSALKQKYQ